MADAFRPIELTEEITRVLCASLTLGAPIRVACDDAGIGVSTYHAWRERGRSDDHRFMDFLERTTRARRSARQSLMADIRKAAPRDWKAAAWMLKHMHPDDFSDRHELTGKDGGPLQVDVRSDVARLMDAAGTMTDEQVGLPDDTAAETLDDYGGDQP